MWEKVFRILMYTFSEWGAAWASRSVSGNFFYHRAGRGLFHPSGFIEMKQFGQKQNTPESPLPINSRENGQKGHDRTQEEESFLHLDSKRRARLQNFSRLRASPRMAVGMPVICRASWT
jgi:hypothetical protein